MSAQGLRLSVQDLQVRYGPPLAVDQVTFDVPSGSVLTILGANGAGKSSIARACSGLVPPSAGQVVLGDQDITGWPADRIRRAGLAYLPETRGVFPTLSVIENLRLAARLVDDPGRALAESFELFPVLADRRRQVAGSMSGGEQQMLALARALVSEPRVVIIDEPSLGLAPLVVNRVFETLALVKARGMTLVLVEQFAHRALALSDHCLIMKRGRCAWSGPAAEGADMVDRVYMDDGAGQPDAEPTPVLALDNGDAKRSSADAEELT